MTCYRLGKCIITIFAGVILGQGCGDVASYGQAGTRLSATKAAGDSCQSSDECVSLKNYSFGICVLPSDGDNYCAGTGAIVCSGDLGEGWSPILTDNDPENAGWELVTYCVQSQTTAVSPQLEAGATCTSNGQCQSTHCYAKVPGSAGVCVGACDVSSGFPSCEKAQHSCKELTPYSYQGLSLSVNAPLSLCIPDTQCNSDSDGVCPGGCTWAMDPDCEVVVFPTLPQLLHANDTYAVQAAPKVDFVVALDGSSNMPLNQAMIVLGALASNLASSGIDYRFILVAGKTALKFPETKPEDCAKAMSENEGLYILQHNTDCKHCGNRCLKDEAIALLDNGDFHLIDSFVHSFNAFDKILERYNVADAAGESIANLRRPAAQLHVVVVSNDEACQMTPGAAESQKGETCVPQKVWDYFKSEMSARGENNFVLDAFVRTTKPAGATGNIGEGYLLGAAETQGMVGDLYLAGADVAQISASYFDQVTINSKGTFILSDTAIPSTVAVYTSLGRTRPVRVREAKWSYNSGNNTVSFGLEYLPTAGTTVTIRYDYWGWL